MSSTVESSPALQNVWRRVTETAEFARLAAEVGRGASVVSISGLTALPARALLVAALARETNKRFAVVVPANHDLEAWERDLWFWQSALYGTNSADAVLTLPASESDPYAGASPHAETLERRALTLWHLARRSSRGDDDDDDGDGGGAASGSIVLLTARALARRTVTPADLLASGAVLERDADYAPEQLVQKLVASGYQREDPIGAVGEFSLRGGILDVWPPGREAPLRIEFFGDTIDSIREFDSTTQLSTAQLRAAEVPPMRELCVTAEDFREWVLLAQDRWSEARYARSLHDHTRYADEGESFPGWEWLLPLARETAASLFDYITDTVLVIDEPSGIESSLESYFQIIEARYQETVAADELGLSPAELCLTAEELRTRIDELQRLELRVLGRTAAVTDESFATEAIQPKVQIGRAKPASNLPLFLFPAVAGALEVEYRSKTARRYHGRIAEMAVDVRRAISAEGNDAATMTLFAMPSSGIAERVAEMLREYAVNAHIVLAGEAVGNDSPAAGAHPIITVGKLSSGFELPSAHLIVHTESDLFDEASDSALERRAPTVIGTAMAALTNQPNQTTQTTQRRQKSKTAAFLSDFRDLKVGDYVVHVDHGISRFGGLQTLDLAGKRGEFVLLYYADDAKLYVPVERLDLVQRYSSGEGYEPSLDRLGGIGWQKTKAKAKRAMRDMADELLRLYAERKLVTGYAFSGDTPWQREFEEGFQYVPTPDQQTAIEDVKHDMEEAMPMDRLLCGDVGYGKTEVAMRAAFKSVMDSRQVAVLTPTTVLAYQHYETFRQRFASFPVTVELLSRFRSLKEQKQVVKRVESGEVDVLIGTHRILSKDLRFRDLGLVIVDEEQRFGVAHKERLKQLKKRVDVLTLTATPIPRTLNMSLMGLRDMSVIETPPRDRLAIQTQVVQFSENVIKSAIELELQRGGQVFFIHNRVESIETIAALVARLVPQARITVAHGQMNEKEMEGVMLDFIAFKHDVLVATTIIENGIDIPRANTIIINRADHYGLAQLYQLRGRVGRSNRRAYAYLLIPSEQELTSIARRRLAAIREFSDLGAGFRIAALDLELRGAGNLLGGEQSGHMDALGFDLYTQMLERTVAELRGETVEDEASVSINLAVDVAIPEDYIADMGQRLRVYKRVSSARDDEGLKQIRAETEDRYGRLPESAASLFEYARLRRMAEAMGVLSIDRTPNGVVIKLGERASVAPDKLLALVAERSPAVASFTPGGVLRIELQESESEQLIETLHQLLLKIREEK